MRVADPYLRDSFAAIRKSLGALNSKNMFDPMKGPTPAQTRAWAWPPWVVWHAADHYGQMVLYLRLNGIVPPASRTNPPKLKDAY
jgi:uncharacterized damage-inducible protein DinB